MSNFAPYQDESREGTAQHARYTDEDNNAQDRLPSPQDFENNAGLPRGGFGNGLGADERNLDAFGTSLPMRLEIEACLAYLLLPPAGGALLLVFEHKNDYVR